MDVRVPVDQWSISDDDSSSGFRVLLVDNSPTCLAIIHAMLQAYSYEVVAVKDAWDALAILRDGQVEFNIVITEVHMPGMNGFELLDSINAEFNKLPVVMISSDNSKYIAWRCLEKGASFYFVKPLTGNNVSKLWQFVFLKKDPEYKWKMGSVLEDSIWAEEVIEKDIECSPSVDEELTPFQKKKRMVWTTKLHGKFEQIVNKLGIKDSTPKKILEMMNEPGLEKKHVASHLQKYRLFVKEHVDRQESDDEQGLGSLDEDELRVDYASPPAAPVFNIEHAKAEPVAFQNYINSSFFQNKPQNFSMGQSSFGGNPTGSVNSMGAFGMIHQQPQQMALTTEAPVSASLFASANQFSAIPGNIIQQPSSSVQPPGHLQNDNGVAESDEDFTFDWMDHGTIIQDETDIFDHN